MAQIVFPVLFLAWSVFYLYFIIYKGDQENKQDRAEGDVWLPELTEPY